MSALQNWKSAKEEGQKMGKHHRSLTINGQTMAKMGENPDGRLNILASEICGWDKIRLCKPPKFFEDSGKFKLGRNMKISKQLKAPAPTIFAALIAITLMIGMAFTVFSAEPQSAKQSAKTDSTTGQTNSVASKTASPDASTKKVRAKRQLTGAELYSINCNRCHPERAPTDWTGAQWKTIMLQMQVRANIPAKQAKLILQFLQENSGR